MLAFPSSLVSSSGEVFIKTLVDVLWYIDGHDSVFADRSCGIPEIHLYFIALQDIMCLRCPSIVSAPYKACHQQLSMKSAFSCLQGTYWTKTGWNVFKSDIQSWTTSLSKYAKYLTDQNGRMKRVHLSPMPIRTISMP